MVLFTMFSPSAEAGRKYNVPAGLNTAQLTSFINSVPDRSTISFPANSTYQLNSTLELTDRVGLTFLGHDATFTTTATDDGNRAQVRLVGGSGWTIQNLNIVGAAPSRDPANAFVDNLQWQHGVDVRGVNGLTLDRVNVSDVYGDCFYLGRGYDGAATKNVNVTGSSCKRNGRQGVAVVDAAGVTVQSSTFSAISLMTFNVEPNVGDSVSSVAFKNNSVGTGPRQQLLGVVGHGPVNGVSLTGNTLTNKPIQVWLDSADDFRIKNVTVTNNTSDTALTHGWMVEAVSVDTLTVTGNHQVLDGAGFVSAIDCTNVTKSQ